MNPRDPILCFFTDFDLPYAGQLKPLMVGRTVKVITQAPGTIAEVEHYANSIKCRTILCTQAGLLNLLIPTGISNKSQSLDSWAGSLYERNGITYLFLNPLRQFYSVSYGKFLAERFISKITRPDLWRRTPVFSWELFDLSDSDGWYSRYESCIAISVDIETSSFEDRTGEYLTVIRCICFTGLWKDGNIHTVVIKIADEEQDKQPLAIQWMRKFCELKIPKIFQNGFYDNFHLLSSYGCICWGYIWDTQSLFHAWFAELPKRLDFIGAFCVHNIFYWKDMATFGGKLYEYNARDGWATMAVWMQLLAEMPAWAVKNYVIKFPLMVPCLVCNLDSQRINDATRQQLITDHITKYTALRARLRTWFGENFNPHSPQQVVKLINFYGSPDITSSAESELDKFALRHPLNARFARAITEARELGKIISTNLKPKDFSIAANPSKKRSYLLQYGRLFYALNPDGTDTGRLACSAGANWTGAQIQNVTESIKVMYEADEGWEDFEVDGSQAEARCVAYKSGDKNLLATVESGRDYHAVNVERFFGIPYDQVVDDSGVTRKVLNKRIRDLSKRTNHGANYNMGAAVLLKTMGEEEVDNAKKLLNLNPTWSRYRVCEHLLKCYEEAYPTVKTDFYQWIVACVQHTKFLVSDLGWTRYCFGEPWRSKPDLNAYVAHVPQNLSVGIVNENFVDAYWEIQHRHPNLFRLKAQIHDSIKGQVRIGHRYLVAKLARICLRAIDVVDCHQVRRSMLIPVEIKIGPNWGSMKTYALEELEKLTPPTEQVLQVS